MIPLPLRASVKLVWQALERNLCSGLRDPAGAVPNIEIVVCAPDIASKGGR